jgi:hypothetical protein
MLKTALIAAAVFLLAGTASAQKIDANGRCHDAKGHFAKAEVCGGAATKTEKMKSKSATSAMTSAKPAAATAPAAAGAAAKPQRCKNDKGKFAKCGSPGAHPA